MSYQLPPDIDKAIQARIQSGEYATADDVLRDALKALDERQHVLIEEDPLVVEGVRRGLANMKAGRSQRLEDFDVEFR